MADRWVQQNLSVEQQVTEIYVATFGRAPDAAGLAYWVNEVETGSLTINQVAQSFFDQPETQAKYPSGTTETSFVLAIYTNALQRSPDLAGLNYWVAELESGAISRELFIISILRGAYDDVSSSPPTLDNSLLTNLRIASEYYSDSPAAQADQFVLEEAYAVLEPVTADASTVALSQALTREFSTGGVVPTVFTLTDGIDNFVGNDADNTFVASVVQNDLGALTNTFETGDVLNGADGRNVLEADLITSASTTIPIGPAIFATTNDIQEVYLHAQTPSSDLVVNWSTVDAERMFGVEQWWTDNSRSTIQIEDVRSLPEETTFGMRQTDPVPGGLGGIFDAGDGASLLVYFDPAQVADDRIVATESDLTLVLVDSSPDANELENFPVDGVVFDLNGERYTVEFDLGEGAERTYANLVTQLNAALDADPELSDLNAVLNADNTVTISDPNGGTFEAVGYTWIGDVVPPSGTLNWDLIVGAPFEETAPVETNVVLDDVGRTSQGGSLDIGSMGDGGVAVFNVTVDRSSWLTEMASNSNLGDGPGNLETVNLVSTGANGDLTVGVLAGCDGRVAHGLTDVRVVDGSDFAGSLNLGIVLSDASIGRYLDDATGEVEFNYTASAQDDIFTIGATEDLTADPDFAMNVLMGAGDDRLNLLGDHTNPGDTLTLSNVAVDGGEGTNTIAVSTSVGASFDDPTDDDAIAASTFESFANFQNYEVEGASNTAHDFTTLLSVTSVVIATEGGADTTLIDLAAGMGVVISGKNQTCGDDESNNDQFFGDIAILGADGATLDVTLDNTARADGQLIVDSLVIADESDDNESAVRTVNLESAGGRDTSNVVSDVVAPRVTTVNLTGTQDLAVHISDLATLPVSDPDLTVDGSTLEGDLLLAINGDLLTNGDDDVITGTGGDNDLLAIYNTDPVSLDTDTTISGFETIQFGWRDTTVGSDIGEELNLPGRFAVGPNSVFDAANTTGVERFVIGARDGDGAAAFTILNIDSGTTVDLGDSTNPDIQGFNSGRPDYDTASRQPVPTTLVADNGGTLDLNIIAQAVPATHTGSASDARAFDLFVDGFADINLDVASYDRDLGYTYYSDRLINLDLDDAARNLIITGGGDTEHRDSVNFVTGLNTTLRTVDVSGYDGDFTASWDSQFSSSNATVVGNDSNLDFDIVDEFGQSVGFFGSQLGVAANYDDGDLFNVTITGSILNADGVLETLDANLLNLDLIAADDAKDASLTALATLLSAQTDTVTLTDGWEYEVDYNATYLNGNLNLSTIVTRVDDTTTAADEADEVLNANEAFITAFSFEKGIEGGDADAVALDLDQDDAISNFITTFEFNVDAYEQGVVWQIDNFNAFGADGVGIGNASSIDLQGLGVDSPSDIKVQDATAWWASLTATEQALYDLGAQPELNTAGNTVVTSTLGDNYTILLTGVDWNDLSNENFAGIA